MKFKGGSWGKGGRSGNVKLGGWNWGRGDRPNLKGFQGIEGRGGKVVLFTTLNHGLLCEGGNTGNVKFLHHQHSHIKMQFLFIY